MASRSSIQEALSSISDEQVLHYEPLAGGSINECYLLNLSNDQRMVVKVNNHSFKNMFLKEANGLKAISSIASAPRAPQVFGVSQSSNKQFLFLEYIETGRKKSNFWEEFGQQLAKMHLVQFERYGFPENNFIGSSIQINDFTDDWVTFFRSFRMEPQIKRAYDNKLLNSSDLKKFQTFFQKIEGYLVGTVAHPSLLHGDLWSGNFLADENGGVVILDPACYYGASEMDLSMTYLFGKFDDKFYKAYFEVFPSEPGFQDRCQIYQTYHLINHLNLFGSGYYSSLMDSVKAYF